MNEAHVYRIAAEISRSFVGFGCWARLFLDGDGDGDGDGDTGGGADDDGIELITVESRGSDGEPQRSEFQRSTNNRHPFIGI